MNNSSNKLDKYDRKLLQELQSDGRISNLELAEKANLSAAPCWRRVRKLEEEGFIDRYTALLNPEKIGLFAMGYIQISLINHHHETLEKFNDFVMNAAEVLECYSVSGNYDFLIRVVASDTLAFEDFLMKKLLPTNVVQSTNTDFVLRQKKYTTQLMVSEQE
ncbi:MAG: Lrp/AsnC family transcriptional regulator [Proteobacteria bacterium]|jgi:Lrp/AsnC family leucine-responsive transcriptional regulator|nr:Lrp/AsnC family transcriptional regulator [Pseudomonadota bacterium]MDA1291429.1 Lrp/AsnC family transcriptional regulator [Pseudomonadota bacterium]